MPFTMTVTTTPQTTVSGFIGSAGGWPGLTVGAILLTGMVMLAAFTKRPRMALAMVTLVAVIGLGACGNGNKTKTLPGTPAGTYPITVAATSGSTTHSMTVTLTVN
jgi:apolipoprotein N-acyltransferase